MRWYDLFLFVHILGAMVLFGAVLLLQRGGMMLRRARDEAQQRQWMGLVCQTSGMFPGGTVMLLVSGVYMAWDSEAYMQPWVIVPFLALFILGAVDGVVISRGLKGVEGAADAGEAHRLANAPALWAGVFANNALLLAIVFVMAYKPGWVTSVLLAVLAPLIGAVVGSRRVRPEAATA